MGANVEGLTPTAVIVNAAGGRVEVGAGAGAGAGADCGSTSLPDLATMARQAEIDAESCIIVHGYPGELKYVPNTASTLVR